MKVSDPIFCTINRTDSQYTEVADNSVSLEVDAGTEYIYYGVPVSGYIMNERKCTLQKTCNVVVNSDKTVKLYATTQGQAIS